ncbi:Hypothetical predicted protein [Mytilus galloprovincialis]|uniref:PHD-type domain-containing protein n=1 Tax=Mytilus galloprovincialis TaxID=29158 RepID=A0A8B6EA32_MYTGA|nr:Hypothetical predicted protein [Mytilus galloprovincialis]
MFYYTVFMLTLILWTRQAFTVHQVILTPQHKYKPTHQDCIYKNHALEGVNIYLSEHHLSPVTSSVQTYYWIKSCKKHIQLTQQKFKTVRERSTQRLILLLLSGIETNPGPRRPRFPCTICQKACKIESIACDDCDKWTHRNCIGMSTSEYSNLGKSEDTWTCPSCCKPNNSSTKIYFIPNGDDSKHSTQNISTNPLMMDSISEASIPSTSGSSINSPSFNTTSFSTDIPIMTSSPKPTKTKPATKKQYLDIEKTLALSKNNDNYDGIMSLSENSRNEILWWIKNVDRNEGKSISFGTPTEYIETDASKIGWGAVYGKIRLKEDG